MSAIAFVMGGCCQRYEGRAIIVGRKFTDQSGKTPAEYLVYYRTVTDDVLSVDDKGMFNGLAIGDTAIFIKHGWSSHHPAR